MENSFDETRKHLFQTLAVSPETTERLVRRVVNALPDKKKGVGAVRRRVALVGALIMTFTVIFVSSPVRQWASSMVGSTTKMTTSDAFPIQAFDVSFHTLPPNALTLSDKSEHTTRIEVNFRRWMITPENTEVFMFLTSAYTPVTWSAGDFNNIDTAIGINGYMKVLWPDINVYLQRNHLAMIEKPSQEYELAYHGTTPGRFNLLAYSKTAIHPSDWRIVMVATDNTNDHPRIWWMKVIQPDSVS